MGSTHYKQTQFGWQKVFLSFYREFTQFVAVVNRSIRGASSEFKLWKAVGDELIFEVAVRDEVAVSRAVRVWLQAMGDYETQVLSAAGALSLKGGAFIATFPGPDSESTIPRDPTFEGSDDPVVLLNEAALNSERQYDTYLYDYFGPSIDTGFRLGAIASHRHFMVSIEVAWAIATAAHNAAGVKADEELHYVSDFVLQGSFALKGVWHGRDYPVFAIDRECNDPVHEALSALGSTPLEAVNVIRVCHACRESENWVFRLYLPDASNPHFREPPENAMLKLIEAETPLDGAETPAEPDTGSVLEASPPLGVRTLEDVANSLTPDEVDGRVPYGPISAEGQEVWLSSFRNSEDQGSRPPGRWYLVTSSARQDLGMIWAAENTFHSFEPNTDLWGSPTQQFDTFAAAVSFLAATT